MADFIHPLPSGTIIPSQGGHFTYRVVGPCCRLFDREQLPWPCCRIQWRGKEPSWRRIGRRFTPDLAAQKAPSYSVEVLEQGCTGETIVLTLYSDRLTREQQDWWYSRRRPKASETRSPLPATPPDVLSKEGITTDVLPKKGTATEGIATKNGEGTSAQDATLPPHLIQGSLPI